METRMHTDPAVYPWIRYYAQHQQRTDASVEISLLPQREAARALRVSDKTLKRLVEDGLIRVTVVPEDQTTRYWQLVDATSLHHIRAARDEQLTLIQASSYVGVSEEQTVALVACGLLDAEGGPSVNGEAIWRFDRNTLQSNLIRLLGHLPVVLYQQKQKSFVNIDRCQRILSGVGVDLIEILIDIREGNILASLSEYELQISNIFFREDVVLQYLELKLKERNSNTISISEARRRLQCRMKHLELLNKTGLLMPVFSSKDGSKQRYQEDDITEYLERYIRTDAAAIILGVERNTVYSWAQMKRIPAVAGPGINNCHFYIFDKVEISQWRQMHLTFGEAIEILGVSKATLDRWVHCGRLVPLDDMGGKQRWFSREAIVRLQKQASADSLSLLD
jgi:predicted site-specific integrase-resolvase